MQTINTDIFLNYADNQVREKTFFFRSACSRFFFFFTNLVTWVLHFSFKFTQCQKVNNLPPNQKLITWPKFNAPLVVGPGKAYHSFPCPEICMPNCLTPQQGGVIYYFLKDLRKWTHCFRSGIVFRVQFQKLSKLCCASKFSFSNPIKNLQICTLYSFFIIEHSQKRKFQNTNCLNILFLAPKMGKGKIKFFKFLLIFSF